MHTRSFSVSEQPPAARTLRRTSSDSLCEREHLPIVSQRDASRHNDESAHSIINDFDATFDVNDPDVLQSGRHAGSNDAPVVRGQGDRTFEDPNFLPAYAEPIASRSELTYSSRIHAADDPCVTSISDMSRAHDTAGRQMQTRSATGSRYDRLRNQHFLSPLQRNK